MFEGIAGGIAGAMLEYATQKKWGAWKIFFYPFFVFTILGLITVYFFPWEYFLYDLLSSIAFGTFAGLVMLVGAYYAKKRNEK